MRFQNISTTIVQKYLWLDNDKSCISEQENDFLCSLVGKGDVAVVANAHVGHSSIALSKAVGNDGYVVAYESQKVLFHALCGNLSIHYSNNVHPLHRAAGVGKDGLYYVPQLGYGEDLSYNKIGPSRIPSYEDSEGNVYTENVSVLAVDDLELNQCDLLYVDVNGTEREVLLGAQKTIKFHKPIIVVNFEQRHIQILEVLQFHGYQYRFQDADGLKLFCFPEN